MSVIDEKDFEWKEPEDNTSPEYSPEVNYEISGIDRRAAEPWTVWMGPDFDDRCFHCGQPISGLPFVYWKGRYELTMHGRCAILFGGAIMRDGLVISKGLRFASKWYGLVKLKLIDLAGEDQYARPRVCLGRHTKEDGECFYRGVTIQWDEDRDERIMDVIDQMPDNVRKQLRFVHESKACLYFLWSAGYTPPSFYSKDSEIEPGDGDNFLVLESRDFTWVEHRSVSVLWQSNGFFYQVCDLLDQMPDHVFQQLSIVQSFGPTREICFTWKSSSAPKGFEPGGELRDNQFEKARPWKIFEFEE